MTETPNAAINPADFGMHGLCPRLRRVRRGSCRWPTCSGVTGTG